VFISRWSACAWGAIGVASAFIALTCWWLTQDRSIPIYDAGYHLETAIEYHNMLRSGDLLGPFNNVLQYPPLALLVGAFAMFIGGVNISSPIIAENLVFVSLLTLGCYQTGRLLFGARAGLLAVIFVLGSPLLIAQFHVFMLDAPETALVAVSMWLILASEDFSRARMAGLAGLAIGCGLLVKVQFPFFLAGIVLTALARGGWRNWRGLATFAAIALVIGAPWYIDHLSELSEITQLAGAKSGAAPGNLPPTLSATNLLWYFWSTLNSQLLAPLFIFVLGGSIWTILAVVRRQEARGVRLEFLVGGFVAWLAITLTPHHDIRYDMPLMPYLAVIGTGWIVHLPRVARLAATGVLVLAVAANTLGSTFGVGGQVEMTLVHSTPVTEAGPDRVVLYSNRGFLVAGPQRDGDVPGLLQALRRNGVRVVAWSPSESQEPDFSSEGISPLAMIAGLESSHEPALAKVDPAAAALIHLPISPGDPPPCTRLSDGTGVWVLRANQASRKLELYCPFRHP
jgi:4-amino-4-deoxy-L-arabinose transferase-like glycosyltransferase